MNNKMKNKMKNTYLVQSIIIAFSIIIISCSGESSSNSPSNVINPNLTHEIIVKVGSQLTDINIAGSDEYSGVASYDIDTKILEINLTGAQVMINAGDTGLIKAESQITIIQKHDQYHLVKEKAATITNFATSINGSTYMCPDLSYIPVIAQGYLQELPLNVNHCLGKDINLTGNIEPIGYPDYDIVGKEGYLDENKLNTIFDGNNKKIIGLSINKANANYIGLFGVIGESGEVKQLTIEDPNVIGNKSVGALAGYINGRIKNITITGGFDSTKTSKVQGIENVGGIIGSSSGVIKNSRVVSGGNNFKISGNKNVGGLVGYYASSIADSIESSYASIDIEYVEPIGDATDFINFGGLVGYSFNGKIINSYSTGAVIGHSEIGGLIGHVVAFGEEDSNIINSYSTGKVSFNGTNTENIGGFIGEIEELFNGQISLENNYFDTEKSGQSDGIGNRESEEGVTGITATEIGSGGSPFIDNSWDFETVWSAKEDGEWPILQWQEQADQ